MKKSLITVLLFISPILCLPANGNTPETGQPVTLERIGESKTVALDNCKKPQFEFTDIPQDWCSATYDKKKKSIVVTAETNVSPTQRETGIVISCKGGHKDTVRIIQYGKRSIKPEFPEDIPVKVSGAKADSENSAGERIGLSYDGDPATYYHSKWRNPDKQTPLNIYYSFDTADRIDYIDYYPREDGGDNGNFKEFDLYVATKSAPALTYYGSYDFKGNSTTNRIYFEPALKDVNEIQFKVKSAIPDGDDFFISCGEMKFMKANPNLSVVSADNMSATLKNGKLKVKGTPAAKPDDLSSIFADNLYGTLKPGVTAENILAIENPFMRELATSIFVGDYAQDTDIRLRTFNASPDPLPVCKINKMTRYSYRDNPTGIFMKEGEDLVVFVEDTHGQEVSIYLQKYDAMIRGTHFTLHNGVNSFTAPYDGLMYVYYYTPEGTEPPLNMHIASGTVNGYFDVSKHTPEDWDRMINNAPFPTFDVLGKHSSLTFETEAFKEYTSDIIELIGLYDDIVYEEQVFQGMHKYGIAPKTRMYFIAMRNSSHMHASSMYTGYDVGTQKLILDPAKLKTTACWGPAHEVGHMNQTRPGLKWAGMTEVTTNIQSMNIQAKWGNESRLVTDGRYIKAKDVINNDTLAFCQIKDVFVQLIPFWQLKLYMHDALGQKDFYKDVYQAVREQDDALYDRSMTHSYYQLEFYKIVCDVAKLDLTEFFKAWGWFIPANTIINDYGKSEFVLTQQQADAAKAYVAAKKYPKAPANIYEITDKNVADFVPAGK